MQWELADRGSAPHFNLMRICLLALLSRLLQQLQLLLLLCLLLPVSRPLLNLLPLHWLLPSRPLVAWHAN